MIETWLRRIPLVRHLWLAQQDPMRHLARPEWWLVLVWQVIVTVIVLMFVGGVLSA